MADQAASHRVIPLSWDGEGYQPLVTSGDWLVALMNWEQRFDRIEAGKIERHNETDEVFVLLKGKSLLYIRNELGIEAVDMVPGVVYNVTRGTWHNVIGSRDATWLIVEAKDTSVDNSDYTSLTGAEKQTLIQQYPAWLRENQAQ